MPELVNTLPLFESVPGLYLVLDPDLRIVTATDAWSVRWTGASPTRWR